MPKIPIKLKNDTIVEALFEIRFKSNKGSVADLLPGLLFANIANEFPTLEKLPITNLPAALIESEPNLRYLPQHRLIGDKYSLLIGEHVFAISCPKPYVGWSEFYPAIIKLTELLEKTSLISEVERFSIRYVNLIPSNQVHGSSKKLRTNITLGAYNLGEKVTQLRTEIVENGFLNVIQIASNATIELVTGQKLEGCLLDIDTICRGKVQNFWKELPSLLQSAHDTEKMIFFSVLTDETIKELEPIWS